MATINSVVLVGNLTRDPELRHTSFQMLVDDLKVAARSVDDPST